MANKANITTDTAVKVLHFGAFHNKGLFLTVHVKSVAFLVISDDCDWFISYLMSILISILT